MLEGVDQRNIFGPENYYLKTVEEIATAVQDCTYFLFGFMMMNLEIQIES